MKIAWGITGAGHYLRESYEAIKTLVESGHQVEIFLSAAGETVAKMYKVQAKLENLQKAHPKEFQKIHLDKGQQPGYPICARFNLGHYDVLVLSPVTSNSVAKMNVGIADTLITNIFAQMIKGSGTILLLPCDLVAGKIETEIPDGSKVKIHIDLFNSKNAKELKKFQNVHLFKTPEEMLKKLEGFQH